MQGSTLILYLQKDFKTNKIIAINKDGIFKIQKHVRQCPPIVSGQGSRTDRCGIIP